MNLIDIKYLYSCCGYCKTTLQYNLENNNYFKLRCANKQCSFYNHKFLTGVFINNGDIVSCIFYFDKNTLNKFYMGAGYFKNIKFEGIKLEEDVFFDLLKNYSKDFDIEKIKNQFNNLQLFI